MKKHHWIGLVVVLLVGYAAGVMFPSFGQNLKNRLTGAGAAA